MQDPTRSTMMQRSEESQALARVVISFLVLLYLVFLFYEDPGQEGLQPAAIMSAVYFLGSSVWWLYLWRSKAPAIPPKWRIRLTIILDLGTTSTGFAITGSNALGLYTIYLWIIGGNGYRYGHDALRFATVVAVLGFATAAWATPTWEIGAVPSIGLMVGVVFIYIFSDQWLTEQRNVAQRADEMQRLATLDPLTNLPNRRAFDDFVERAHTDRQSYALLVLDLDGFKKVNDTYGHAAGDALLVAASGRMSSHVRMDSDLLARPGGDEFVVVAKNADWKKAGELADRLRDALCQPFLLPGGATATIGVSIGIALGLEHDNAHDAVRAADRKMYDDKIHRSTARCRSASG